MKKLICLFLLINSYTALTQNFSIKEKKQIDSLLIIWNNFEEEDTTRADAFQNFILTYFLSNNPDSAYVLATEYYTFTKQKKLKYRMSTALLFKGLSKYFVSDYEEAIHYYLRCLKLRINSGNQVGIASVYNNIGLVYQEQGAYSNALTFYLKSLKIEENLKNENGIASTLNNIGIIYKEEGDFNSALEYYNRSLKIKLKLNDKVGESHAHANIGVVYLNQDNYEDALISFEQALIANNGHEESLNAQINYDIGRVHFELGHYNTALDYVNKALHTHLELNDRVHQSASLNLIASIHFKQNSTIKAISFALRALKIAQEIGAKEKISDITQNLSMFYKASNKPEEALDMYILFMDTQEKIDRENMSNEILRQSAQYEFDKKIARDSIENAYLLKVSKEKVNNEREKKEIAEQKSFFLFSGLFLTLCFGIFIFNRLKVTAKQKSIIETQKKTVDRANKELKQINEELVLKRNEINLQKQIVQGQNEKLTKTLETEKELGLLKTNFVSMASHQYRTPLAVIQSNVELLNLLISSGEKIESEKNEKITGRIKREISKMTELMDEVLVLGKLTSGNVTYNPQEIDLVEFCNELIERFNSIQEDGRVLDFEILGEPSCISLDVKLLTHSLSNLVSNAFKYSTGNKNPQLTINFKPKELLVSVKDYGIGIPESELSYLFQPFFRANNVTEIKGTGLGLNIAKEYIELNKGRITAASTLGKGSCFEIAFSAS